MMSKYEVQYIAKKPRAKITMYSATKKFDSFVKACWCFYKLKKNGNYKIVLNYQKDSEGNNE